MYRLCVGYVSEDMGSEGGVNKEDNIDNYFLSRIRSNERLLPWHQHCATARGNIYQQWKQLDSTMRTMRIQQWRQLRAINILALTRRNLNYLNHTHCLHNHSSFQTKVGIIWQKYSKNAQFQREIGHFLIKKCKKCPISVAYFKKMH